MSYNNILLKVVLIGKANVGKTSILNQLIYNKYNQYSDSTIGASFFSKEYDFLYSTEEFKLYKCDSNIEGKKQIKIKLAIWDTAGQERYNSLVPMYYRNAHIIFFVNEATQQLLFTPNKEITRTIEELNSNIFESIDKNAIKYMVFNKCDLLEDTIYNTPSILNKHNIHVKYVSAFKNINIENIFTDGIIEYINTNYKDMLNPIKTGFNIDEINNVKKSNKCC